MSEVLIFPMNMARLCIDRYEGDLSGRVYSKQQKRPLTFSGYGEMLLRMDDMFDRSGYPQAFQERRSFRQEPKKKEQHRLQRPLKEYLNDSEMQKQKGIIRTLDVVVQSRRRSGWQGLLMDPERTRTVPFRSEMELLDCICQEMERTG